MNANNENIEVPLSYDENIEDTTNLLQNTDITDSSFMFFQ